MHSVIRFKVRRALFLAVIVSPFLAAVGCGSGFRTVPVQGRLLLNGQPLTGMDAKVVFRPDPAKGNTVNFDFSGKADKEGNYTLYYGSGTSGVAPGWYKVAVVATEPLDLRMGPGATGKKIIAGPPIRKTVIDRKYTVPTSSGIEIEVVENPAPGAYDLNLTGPANK